ncbi:MAG TPA: hypothetical protein VF602_05230 [Pedobacter sp.]|jgi:hypothetical protein
MSGKSIFIIIVSVLVTIILMNNTDAIDFWIFGITKVPKLAILGVMFATGFVLGVLAGRPKKKEIIYKDAPVEALSTQDSRSGLTEEDKDYIN